MIISALKKGVSGLKVMTQQIEILNKTFSFAIEKLDNKISSSDRKFLDEIFVKWQNFAWFF